MMQHNFQIMDAEMPRIGPSGYSDEALARRKSSMNAHRKTPVNLQERRMIAWDGEGAKLSGPDKPQHYVLFGCSAEIDNPLVIKDPKGTLSTGQICQYICRIGSLYPNAFHVGYFFRYDQNMIVQSLSPRQKLALYQNNSVGFKWHSYRYRISWIPGKRLRITERSIVGDRKVTVSIDDFASFFATSFVKAYSGIFPNKVDTPEFNKIVEGKANRADTTYEDMPEVQAYWREEIQALEELADTFRNLMYNAGFMLREWYGPGALANYIRRDRKLITHEWGGKSENMPRAVHEASKAAYFGGRFEQFKAGRIRGPIYAYDINSAYPAGFVHIPSLAEGGEWVKVVQPTSFANMGIYHLKFRHTKPVLHSMPYPLPHRDHQGNITYPPFTDGWYFRPEMMMVMQGHWKKYTTFVEGWEWKPANKELPWDFFREMYETRLQLKDAGNPTQMAYKLALNSMYGKMAQRAGWNKDRRLPPRAHTLPLAGWITSFCRATMLEVMIGCKRKGRNPMDPRLIIAIETDGIFTTQSPEELNIIPSNVLGGISVKRYEEILFVQNGLYLAKDSAGEWHSKTRGMDASSITHEVICRYLVTLNPRKEWKPTQISQRERFLGLGAAISRSTNGAGVVNPFKMNSLHCTWEKVPKQMAPGLKGKRLHQRGHCPTCKRGLNAFEAPHPLAFHTVAYFDEISHPYILPWELDYKEPSWIAQDEIADDEMAIEAI